MADGTHLNILTEVVASMRAQQETQQKYLEELVSQVSNLSVKIQTLIEAKELEPEGRPPGHGNYNNNIGNEYGGLNMRLVKLEFPRFEGADPAGWIYRANQFFNYHNTQNQRKVLLASFHMEGRALVWFQDLEESGALTSWDALVKAMLTRFGPNAYDDPMEALTRLRQTTTVENYKSQFECVSL